MNFYSDELINKIIDKEELDKIIDEIDIFKLQCKYVLTKYSIHTIYHKYTDWVLNDSKAIIAFYCLDNEFCIYNCPSMLVYRKVKYEDEIRYYVLLTCTKRSFRGQGYGTILLDEFQKRIRKETNKAKIILSSVEEAVIFYENYGFRWTRETLADHPILLRYEALEDNKEYFILEFCI
jgi:ribosomal protein S18 acetylase RimI-like enzyme